MGSPDWTFVAHERDPTGLTSWLFDDLHDEPTGSLLAGPTFDRAMTVRKRIRESAQALLGAGTMAALGVLALGPDLFEATRHLHSIEPMLTGHARIEDLEIPESCFARVSDIYAHLPTLYRTTVERGLQNVLELGTRTGESTVVLLAATREISGHVTSVDVAPCPEAKRKVEQAGLAGHWTFILSDDLALDWNRSIDHLFIDTSHEYLRTKRELGKFEPFVRRGGVISLHDTTSHIDVWRSVTEYFEGRKDVRIFRFLHNNGLAIIEKLG
jgi:predicted O-methyltransferase YrrM